MSAITIYTRASRADIRRMIALLPLMFSGKAADTFGLVQGFKLRLAVAFWSKVKQAFIEKSRGGTDETGDKWAPLSRAYLAYQRRFGPGEKAALKAGAGLGKGNRLAPGGKDGLLTKAQLEEWRRVFARNVAWLSKTHGEKEAKGIAAGIAWNTIKAHGARTKLEVYGTREVEILRDTGILFNSISPGAISTNGPAASYAPPENQILEDAPGSLVVGTNVKYANAHQNGIRVPQRRILPDPDRIPAGWLDDFAEQATEGFVAAAHEIARRAA